MKTLLLILLLSSTTFAIEIEIIGPCKKGPIISQQYQIDDLSLSVGYYSVAIFEDLSIPYIGSEGGMNSILNTPTGKKAIEVLSKTKMRAHGWCYQVDGIEPAAMTNNYFFPNKSSHLKWIFGYSTFEGDILTGEGTWTGYCDPTYKVKPRQFCE